MEELKKGQNIKIKFNLSSIRSYEINCLIKWFEHDRLVLAYPEEEKNLSKYLHEGKDIEVVIYSDKGIYAFDSVVIDSPLSRSFVIEFPEEKSKIQRREYVRAALKLEFSLSKDKDKTLTETINIGGGGVRFISDKEFKTADLWDFVLYLSDNNSFIKGKGEILYSIKQNYGTISVIKFVEIDESARNKIIKLCFEEEANKLRKRTNMTNGLKEFI